MRTPVTVFITAIVFVAAGISGCGGGGMPSVPTLVAKLNCNPAMSGSKAIAVSFACNQPGSFARTANMGASELGFQGTFSVSSSNSGVASVTQMGGGNQFMVSAGQSGSTRVMITDGRGNEKDVDVEVKDMGESPEPQESESPEPSETP